MEECATPTTPTTRVIHSFEKRVPTLSVYVSPTTIDELKRIISDSEIIKEDDKNWPPPNKEGKQELEIKLGKDHISFVTSKFGSFIDVQNSNDPEGLKVFYYLLQDLKCLVFSLISLHFRVPT